MAYFDGNYNVMSLLEIQWKLFAKLRYSRITSNNKFLSNEIHDEYIESFLIYTFNKYISSYIFKCIDFGATPSYSTQECMQSFLHPIYLWCSRCFKSHKSQIRKMKVQRLQQKIQWHRKCNILIRQKNQMKTKEISFFEKKCMFEERIKPQELYEIAKKCF